jgi:hypothetical protein
LLDRLAYEHRSMREIHHDADLGNTLLAQARRNVAGDTQLRCTYGT